MIYRHAGFTVLELMITVALIAVLSVIAAPSLRDLIKNGRMTSQANDLMTDLAIARGEAVKRGVRTAICTSSNGTACTATPWNQGWIIFADHGPEKGGTFGVVDSGIPAPDTDTVLKRAPAIDGANENPPNTITTINASVNAGATYVGFRPSGVVTPGGAGAEIDFLLCDSRTTALVGAGPATDKGRHIRVAGTGRAYSVRCTCATSTTCAP
jgi:prepilin-type N-terminal cleavage/methylation domain-containing protein